MCWNKLKETKSLKEGCTFRKSINVGGLQFQMSFIEDLDKRGYCVIPQVLGPSECDLFTWRLWKEYIEKSWPKCKYNDRTTWKEHFPIQSGYGIFSGSAGQTQVCWDIRQHPRVVEPFAKLWNCKPEDLVVSMDGFSMMCPRNLRDQTYMRWPHVDQTTKKNPISNNFVSESCIPDLFSVQGQVLLEDSLPGDAGFYCIPGSNRKWKDFVHEYESSSDGRKYLEQLFPEMGTHICARQGSLILWDSRTVHYNQFAADPENANLRLVTYVSYVPKSRLTPESIEKRKQAFENTATGHSPVDVELKYAEWPHVWDEYRRYLPDTSYRQPRIVLSELGKSLLSTDCTVTMHRN